MTPSPEDRCSCGKVKYKTKAEARARLPYRKLEGGREDTVYLCPDSMTYHLGFAPRKQGRRKPFKRS